MASQPPADGNVNPTPDNEGQVVEEDNAFELTDAEKAGAILSAYNHVSKRIPLPWLKSPRILAMLDRFDAFGTLRKEEARAVGTVAAAKAAISDIKESFTDLNKQATEIAVTDLGWLAPPERPKKPAVEAGSADATKSAKRGRGTTEEKVAAPKRPRSVEGMLAYLEAHKTKAAATAAVADDDDDIPPPPA